MGETTKVWIGWVLSGVVVLALLADAATNLFAPQVLAGEMAATGYDLGRAPALAAIILVCAAIYAVPRTAVLGAILITAFFGGAIATHFRVGEMGTPPQIICVVLATLAWGGLYLRDQRIRALLPLTR